jgi:hypothetical protein
MSQLRNLLQNQNIKPRTGSSTSRREARNRWYGRQRTRMSHRRTQRTSSLTSMEPRKRSRRRNTITKWK